MKTNILIHSIAALLVALPFTHAEDPKSEEKKDAAKSERKSSSSSIVTSAEGTATITIDINGKKETRTFRLGDGSMHPRLNGDGHSVRDMGLMKSSGKVPSKTEKGVWLGIGMDPVSEVVRAQLPLAPGEGVIVSHVMSDSPAQKAGLAENDILVRFDDQIIVEHAQVKKLIAMQKPGKTVKLIYLRKGERKEASVTLGEHEIEVGEMSPARWFQNAQGLWSPRTMKNERLEDVQAQIRHWKETVPGGIADKRAPIGGASSDALKERLEKLQRALKDSQLPKEVIEDMRKELELLKLVANEAEQQVKRNPISPEEMLKGQFEKLKQNLKNSGLPKEEIENIIKNLDHMRHEAEEALERTKRNADEIMKNAQRAVEEAAKAINESRRQHEQEKGGKKPGEPQ